MGEIDFLGLDDVLEIHRDQIERYGGSAGIRDVDLLRSALAMPQATFDNCYLHEDIFAMAAAYLFHITQNHPFIDGNKRTGAVASIVFLALNDIELSAPEADLERLIWDVAEGKADKEAIARFFRQHYSDLSEQKCRNKGRPSEADG
ncbi:MAG: type II toxin-antitoxin system death-on-curing family toxin [Armatimonadetes bacterium]|nr:type II toxin-antitoxin system death-on-curing family toxin [Armatimonadota bacterium]